MAQKVETVFEVKQGTNSELFEVKAVGEKAALAIDKKFKGKKSFVKILRGFNINGDFYPFTPPKIYGRA